MNLFQKAKNIIFFLGIISGSSSCIGKNSDTVPPEAPIKEVVSITGGSVAVKASDSVLSLKTQDILDSEDLPVKDGTEFIVTGTPEIGVSSDGENFSLFSSLKSLNGKLSFFVKPPNQVGNYRVTVTQKQKQSKNANGFFYIGVKPSDPDDLGQISTNTFKDEDPVNLIKDESEYYTLLADGRTQANITVGPIVDRFGNIVESGFVRLVTNRGSISSLNPTQISSGFVNFSIIPDESTDIISIKAQAVDEAENRIIKEVFSNFLPVKPNLEFSGDLYFGEAFTSVDLTRTFTLSNTGSAPVNNLQLRLIPPYRFSSNSPCPLVLNPGQVCSFDVIVNSSDKGDKYSELEISAQPETVDSLKFRKLMHSRFITPPKLVLSSQEQIFGEVACGEVKELKFFVQNLGEKDAFNFQVIDPTISNQDKESSCSVKLDPINCEKTQGCAWKTSKGICSSGQFELIKPQRDPLVDLDDPTLTEADCGDIIPANGIKCRLIARYRPNVLTSGVLETGRLSASFSDSVPVILSASSSPGKPVGNIPINFSAPKMNIGLGNSIGVTIGPVKDACGSNVSNSSEFTAEVSAGSLDKNSGLFSNGFANFIWTSIDDFSKLGEQTFNLTSNQQSEIRSITFSGVYLKISGQSDIGQVTEETPEVRSFVISNDGNETAENVQVSFETPVNITPSIESNNCSSLAPGITCLVSIRFDPELSVDKSAKFFGKIVASSSSSGRNIDKFNFIGFADKSLQISNNSVNNYSIGTHRAAESLTRTITIKNSSGVDLTNLNYGFKPETDSSWSFSLVTCGQVLLINQSCKILVSSLSTLAGDYLASFEIKNNTFSSSINLSTKITGADPAIIPVSFSSEEIPADGLSEVTVTAGPILDLYGNIIPEGSMFLIETEKGSILTGTELSSDSTGRVTSKIRSEKNSVGFSRVKIGSIGANEVVSGIKNIKFTGVFLEFDYPELNFGDLAMNLTKDITVKLTNKGNILAEGLFFESSDPVTYSVLGTGSCSNGTLGAGENCDISIRFLSPISDIKSENRGSITVRSTTNKGNNIAVLPTKGVNMLPATMISEKKSISVELVSNSFYVTNLVIHNIGDDIFRNFSVNSNKPENLTFSEFDSCEGLIGGGSCSVKITFNSLNLETAFSSIISLSADGTSSQVTFTSDKIKLAIKSDSFTDNVFSCNPVSIESQDSNGNQMTLRNSSSISLSSIRESDGTLKKGQFFRTKLCTGTPVSRTEIFQGNSVSSTVYFRPEVAGKHTIVAKLGNIITKQDNQANLIVSPGVIRTAFPREPIPFIVQGANGNISCEFIVSPPSERKLTDGGRPGLSKQAGLIESGTTCNYISGTVGEVTDNFIIKDQDSPPNTIGISVNLAKSIQIRPLNREIESGGQIQFFAEFGSGNGYTYSVIPEAYNKKLGSYFSNNIYTAGQNVTDSEFVKETIVVKDSFGAESSTTVLVKRSIFKNEFTIDSLESSSYNSDSFIEVNKNVSPPIKGFVSLEISPSSEEKSISIWKNRLIIGDKGAFVGGIARAGAVYVYKKVKNQSGNYIWEKERTFVSLSPVKDGEFGSSVSLFNDILVVGSPNEIATPTTIRTGSAYVISVDLDKALGQNSVKRIPFFRNGKIIDSGDEGIRIGSIVRISGNSIIVSTDIKGVYSILDYSTSETLNPQQNKNEVNIVLGFAEILGGEIAPENDDDFTRTMSNKLNELDYFDNKNYGGKFIFFGQSDKNESVGEAEVKYIPSFPEDEDDWSITTTLSTGNDLVGSFGKSVSTYGPYYAVGAPNSLNKVGENTGIAYVYKRNPKLMPFSESAWDGVVDKLSERSTIFTIDPSDYNLIVNESSRFGESISIWGNYLLIGAPGEKNYPELQNSGSVYVFQRYYSNDNKWEYLGQLRAPDYGSNDEFGKKIEHYGNDFIISSNKSVYFFSGGKLENKWPFGYHDDFTVSGVYEHKQGEMKDFSTLVVPSGQEYRILYPDFSEEIEPYMEDMYQSRVRSMSSYSRYLSMSQGRAYFTSSYLRVSRYLPLSYVNSTTLNAQWNDFFAKNTEAKVKNLSLINKLKEINSRNKGWTYIGVAGYLRVEGKISAKNNPFIGRFKNKAPDESGFNLGGDLNFFLTQRLGGVGISASGGFVYNSPYFWNKEIGRKQSLNALYKTDLDDEECADPAGVCENIRTDYIGSSGNNGELGYGGVGGSISSRVCVTCECRDSYDYGDNYGSPGGKPGKHGGVVYIKADSLIGGGQIDVSGNKGEDSIYGHQGISYSVTPLSFGGDDDNRGLDWCRSCARERGLDETQCDDGDNPGAAQIVTTIQGFQSGCGGGGAGGSGGTSIIEFNRGNGIGSGYSFNLSPGSGGDSCESYNYNPPYSGVTGVSGIKKECDLTKNSCL